MNSFFSSIVIFSTFLSTIVYKTPEAFIAYSKGSPTVLLVEIEKDQASTSNIWAEGIRSGELFLIFLEYMISLKCKLWSFRYQA